MNTRAITLVAGLALLVAACGAEADQVPDARADSTVPTQATEGTSTTMQPESPSPTQPENDSDVGPDTGEGDKGNPNGDPNASGYYGNGGGGSGGNYRLGNRKAVSKPKPTYDCNNEEGTVVVRISVDKNGKVISAQPGIKGTTNSDTCLLTRAKEAALKTKFNPDSKAPTKQVGSIIYNFTLSN